MYCIYMYIVYVYRYMYIYIVQTHKHTHKYTHAKCYAGGRRKPDTRLVTRRSLLLVQWTDTAHYFYTNCLVRHGASAAARSETFD